MFRFVDIYQVSGEANLRGTLSINFLIPSSASDLVFISKQNINSSFIVYIRSETVPHFHNNTFPNSTELYLDSEGDSHEIFNTF